MARVRFLHAADAEYELALAWYRARSRQAATNFETAVSIALQNISEAPERWPVIDKRHRFYTLKKFPYSVVYRIDPDEVVVVAIPHSRQLPSIFGRG